MAEVTKLKVNYIAHSEPSNPDEGMLLLARLFVLFADGVEECVRKNPNILNFNNLDNKIRNI